MGWKKPNFRPKVTRIKLNPEQAVLTCSCYDGGTTWDYYGPGHYLLGVSNGPSCATRMRCTIHTDMTGDHVMIGSSSNS